MSADEGAGPATVKASEGRSSGRLVANLAVLLLVVLIAALAGLVALPFSTSLISSATPEEAGRRPTPDFRIGGLEWRVSTLALDPELAWFRQRFSESCEDRKGVEAAICLSSLMARAFPNGAARSEFVDIDFDPEVHAREHLAGQAGHCMNRSALMVTDLLASGIPARVVQLLGASPFGHTLVEVWDEKAGWVLVDPTFGQLLLADGEFASAIDLVSRNRTTAWAAAGVAPDGPEEPRPIEEWDSASIIYPEPWLYLRRGTRLASWPFRARYAVLVPSRLELGPAQNALRVVALLAGAGLPLCIVFWFRANRGAWGRPRIANPAPVARDRHS